MTAGVIPLDGDDDDRVWSSRRYTITRNGPWHVTLALRGCQARSYTNREAAALAADLAEAAEREPR